MHSQPLVNMSHFLSSTGNLTATDTCLDDASHLSDIFNNRIIAFSLSSNGAYTRRLPHLRGFWTQI